MMTISQQERRHVTKRYRVLKARFVYSPAVLVQPTRKQTRASEFVRDDVFAAQPCTLLRRAVRDEDIVEVSDEQLPAADLSTKRERRGGKEHA